MNATHAKSMEFHCSDGAKCESAEIYCPSNDDTVAAHWGTSCMLCALCVYSIHYAVLIRCDYDCKCEM